LQKSASERRLLGFLEDRAKGRRASGEIARLLLRDGDAPRRAANRHRLDNLQRRHVDHRDIVAVAVGGEQQFLVRSKGKLPDPLADEQIFLNLELLGVETAT
jgi:hypothetical protein